jgi:hypothetical protein
MLHPAQGIVGRDRSYGLAAEMIATESRLAALWAKLLGVKCAKIGPATGLFDFGGHSLMLVKLA